MHCENVNFLLRIVFGNSAGKSGLRKNLWKSATKRWLLKTKGEKSEKSLKNYKMEKAVKFIIIFNIHIKNFAEICTNFLKPPHQ